MKCSSSIGTPSVHHESKPKQKASQSPALVSAKVVQNYATWRLWFDNHERPNRANGGLPPKQELNATERSRSRGIDDRNA